MKNFLLEISSFVGVLGLVFLVFLLTDVCRNLCHKLSKGIKNILKDLVEKMYPGFTLTWLYGIWMIVKIEGISIQMTDSSKRGLVERNKVTLWDEKARENVRIRVETRQLKEALEKTGTWQLEHGLTFAVVQEEEVVFLEKGTPNNVLGKVKKADLFSTIERLWK